MSTFVGFALVVVTAAEALAAGTTTPTPSASASPSPGAVGDALGSPAGIAVLVVLGAAFFYLRSRILRRGD